MQCFVPAPVQRLNQGACRLCTRRALCGKWRGSGALFVNADAGQRCAQHCGLQEELHADR